MSINMKMRSGVPNSTGLTCGNKCTRKLPTYVILVSIIYQADVLQFFLLLPGGSQWNRTSFQDMSRSRTLEHTSVWTQSQSQEIAISQSSWEGMEVNLSYLGERLCRLIERRGPWLESRISGISWSSLHLMLNCSIGNK